MNPRNRELERFFEYDVKEAIPKLVKEYAELSEMSETEMMDLYNDSKLVICTQEDSGTTYKFMTEPYITVDIWDDHYSVRVADQEGERLFFRTTEIDAFIRYWNTDIVGYFGQNVRFPEIKE